MMGASTQFQHPFLKPLGYFSLVCLLLLSMVFYRERALFADLAYQTFLLIKEGGLQVQVYRFGSAVVQLLPLTAIKLGLPLKVISLLYSMSFPLLFLFFYFLIVRVFRNEYLGWVLVFLFTLTVYDAFYWPSSEQQQGLAFLLVVFAFIHRFPALDKVWMWPLLFFGLVAVAYYHPLVFIPFFYLWAFFLIGEKKFRHSRYLGIAVLMLAVLIIKTKIAANWYDDDKYSTFFDNLRNYFPNYFSFESHKKFLANSLKYWYFFPLLLAVVSVFYIRYKKWLKLVLLLLFCFAYIMLLHIGAPKAVYRFYSEVNYMPLSIFVILPFIFDVVPKIRQPRLVLYLFAAIVFIRLLTIGLHHRPFSERLGWLEGKITQGSAHSAGNRFLIQQSKAPMDTLLISWGIAYETLLMTAMQHPDSAKTLLVLPGPGRYATELESDDYFISEFAEYPVEEIDCAYFRLGKGRYEELE